MDFHTAVKQCRSGQYFKALNTGWGEQSIQYGRHDDGSLFWTAGCTVGGPLNPKEQQPDYVLEADYGIYSTLYAVHPIIT